MQGGFALAKGQKVLKSLQFGIHIDQFIDFFLQKVSFLYKK